VLLSETAALAELAEKLSGDFAAATRLLLDNKGKVVLSGVGKSGLVAQKIAATFCSTGTPAIFLHSADAVHGDLGVFHPGDPAILVSKSGATAEVLRLVPTIKHFGSPIIAITCNAKSPLGRQADAVIEIPVRAEADPLGLVPTTSALLTLAVGDALAAALMVERGFQAADFARFHPAGQLGRNLLLTVGEVMHPIGRIAAVGPDAPLRELVIAMTEFPLGAACVLDPQGLLAGLVTDGDLRRALRQTADLSAKTAGDVMTRNPVRAAPGMSLGNAAQLMEARASQLSVLPVTDPDGLRCVGLIRIHDIYQSTLP
jgi:arabinose-5-phosphate isomerase